MSKFKGKTHIIAILDRSGSMRPLVSDTIGGYNGWLKQLKEDSQGQDVALTLHLFDTQHEFPHIAADLADVGELTPELYYARGGTALLDAIGQSVSEIKGQMGKQDRALCLIITDGYENSSREYTNEAIAKLIKKCEKKGNWTFDYLGANQDAFAVGASMNVGSTYSTQASPVGTRALWRTNTTRAGGMMTNSARSQAPIDQADYDQALADEEAKLKADEAKQKM